MVTSSQELGAALGRLTTARRTWFAVVAATATPAGLPDDVVLIDATAVRGVPLTMDPFEPEPGCAVQAHAERLAALFEAAFRPPDPVRTAVRLALRRAYLDCGWDLVTGSRPPGAVAPPVIPSLGDLRRAARAVVADLDGDAGDAAERAAVLGFLDATLGSLWLGPAGHFLAGGHPADVPGLFGRNVIFTAGDVAADEGAAFLTGIPLIRLAERLRLSAGPGANANGRGTEAPVVVVCLPARTVRRLPRLLDELRGYRAEVIVADYPPRRAEVAVAENADSNGLATVATARPDSAAVPLLGRRSVACGPRCGQRACTGFELHAVRQLADAGGQVWLRLWGQALVLAFVTGRPLPRVPVAARRGWATLDPRTRECLLATILQTAVGSRARALRHSYDPRRLVAAVASTATAMVAAATTTATSGTTIPSRAGHLWVIPQLRWLHETERLLLLGRDDIAPPLDFTLGGLPDWPGIRAGDRLDALRRHRLSMDAAPNRVIATTALLGAEAEGAPIHADLATAGVGLAPPRQVTHAAAMLDARWLEAVLSWPSRLIGPAAHDDIRRAATG
jgi:hypothetical protein